MIHLVELGDPRRPGLVFFHGFLGSHRDFREIAGRFSKDFHIILPDLPGHGKTPPPVENPFEAPHAFLKELAGLLIQKHDSYRALVGYSMGGRLAQAFAILFPGLFSSLVLESTSPGIADAQERLDRKHADQKIADRMKVVPLSVFLEEWYAQPLFADLASDPIFLSETIALRLSDGSSSYLAAALEWLSPGIQPSYWEQLGRFKWPTCLIAGERDKKYLDIMRRMKNLIPASRMEVISGAGHNAHRKSPDSFSQVLREFIEP
ncbi:MAG: 2-succinyl-6-hydroxy-2,4-cyclohexadiene-1-carboxylate synthase [Spirochaetia bacterium]|nr:2-succinyl-6-hydroxy-2,4-cyclohexadiene-1-carboxylate synthase [Spirochaetia bacterium]